jgi:hypothetical protein
MSCTTDSSTLCWRSTKLGVLAALLCLSFVCAARAEGIVARSAQLDLEEGRYRLRAHALEDLLTRGVPLYFVLELDVWRQRDWWFDKRVVSLSNTRKLSYNSLTRQYRLASGGLYQNFFQLNEALRVLGRVRGTPALDTKVLRANRTHHAEVRMSLDVSQLPSLFQLDALASPEWNLTVSAYSWDITP